MKVICIDDRPFDLIENESCQRGFKLEKGKIYDCYYFNKLANGSLSKYISISRFILSRDRFITLEKQRIDRLEILEI